MSRRWWLLAALVLAVLMHALGTTVVIVALPTIATDLDAGTAALQWMVNAYLLVSGRAHAAGRGAG